MFINIKYPCLSTFFRFYQSDHHNHQLFSDIAIHSQKKMRFFSFFTIFLGADGLVDGTALTQTCEDACGGDCCVGPYACLQTTASIKKDQSCNGDSACEYVNDNKPVISGPSYVGTRACSGIGLYPASTTPDYITNSCRGIEACTLLEEMMSASKWFLLSSNMEFRWEKPSYETLSWSDSKHYSS